MQYTYSVFGLEILANVPLPGLLDSPGTKSADVRVWMGRIPDTSRGEPLYYSPYKNESGEPSMCVRRLENGCFHFEYRDHTSFVINRSGSEVWAHWPDELTLEDTATYLLGPVFGFVLRLRGVVCLHASGIIIEGAAIALVGAAGAGKSTTAAAFARLGFPIITDDVFTLVERGRSFYVHPGYPGLRLWPDSVNSLWGSPEALPTITPTWDKRYLNLMENGYEFEIAATPVSAIYVIGNRCGDSSAPVIQNNPQPGLLSLIANTYGSHFLDRKMRAHEFALLGRLATTAPIQMAVPHADPARLPELCHCIVKDVHALLASQAKTHVM